MRKSFRLVLCQGLLWLVLCGCAPLMSKPIDLADVEVVNVPTSVASVSKADAYLKDDRLVVTGMLRRMHEVKIPGHIDILVCGPQGLLERKSVPVSGLSSKRKGAMNLPFTAHFTVSPPQGSKIIIRYHAPPFEGETFLPCG